MNNNNSQRQASFICHKTTEAEFSKLAFDNNSQIHQPITDRKFITSVSDTLINVNEENKGKGFQFLLTCLNIK